MFDGPKAHCPPTLIIGSMTSEKQEQYLLQAWSLPLGTWCSDGKRLLDGDITRIPKALVGQLCSWKMPIALSRRLLRTCRSRVGHLEHARNIRPCMIPWAFRSLLLRTATRWIQLRPCPLIYYYEQLLEDMRHIITHLFEVIPRTIMNPIPKAHSSSSLRNIKSTSSNSSSSAVPDHYAWRQPKSSKGKKTIPSAD
jgi:hypothetical protein